MSRFERILNWFRDSRQQRELSLWFSRNPLPPVVFADIQRVDKPPSNEVIAEGAFYFVLSKNRPRWALFQCPCGCKNIITLSLQRVHSPHWAVQKSRNDRPNLTPSVWRDIGCMSHFWIHDGRVYWCHNSGTSPSDAFRNSF